MQRFKRYWREQIDAMNRFFDNVRIDGDIARHYGEAWWPVSRLSLVAAATYYALLTVLHARLETGWMQTVLSTIALSSAATFLAMFWATGRVTKVRLWQVEAINLTTLAILLANIYTYQLLHLQVDRLNNFILLPVLIAVIGGTFRIIVPCILICFCSLLFFAGQIGPNVQTQFLTLILGSTVSAVVIHLIVRYIAVREIRARLAAEVLRDAARARADFDGLTGLANRSRFFSALDDALRRTDISVAVAVIDLDGFKAINDIYGNATGNGLLVAVAGRLRKVCNQDCLTARIGSDEFAIILEQQGDPESIKAVFSEWQRIFDEPFEIEGRQLHITASMGVVPAMGDVRQSRVIVERADFALFRAKRERSGGFVLFSEELSREMENLGAIEHTLRNSDLVRELSLEYQPQVDMHSNKIVAFEALARWDSERLGRVPPDLFIGVAERGGFVDRLTRILLGKAMAAARTWPEHIGLSFNLSARDLMSTVALNDICQMVRDSGIAAHRIEFEVTETSVMTDFDKAKQAIRRLKRLGCRVALDDFGAGYSNFAYIDKLELDTIKLDRAFVTRMRKSERTKTIIATIIELCRNLGMTCVVEGVEYEDEAAMLKTMGGLIVQGYLFGRPVSAGEVTATLDTQSGETKKPLLQNASAKTSSVAQ